jgi:hypothetical protein
MTLATTRAINRSPGHLYTLLENGREYGPFPGATAICKVADSLMGGDLAAWGANQALDEIASLLPLNVSNQSTTWGDARRQAFQAVSRQRDMGTAVHAVADQLNSGMQLQMFTDGVAPYIAHYGAALVQKGITVIASERYCVNTDIGFGGTYDSLVEIDGECGILDVKTGKAKASQRLQLTGLSMTQWHGGAGLEAAAMPPLDDVGWILLLRPDGYELVRHEITDEDREHFVHLVETFHRIKAWAAQFQPTAIKQLEEAA